MPFEVGNTYGKRPKPNAGRPPKAKQDIKKAAAQIAREFIEENVKPVLDNYLKLAKGYYDTRYTDDGMPYDIFVTDGPTTRHFVDKLLPDEQIQPQIPALSIFIGQAVIQRQNPEAGLRPDSLQILVSSDNGKNGNGSNGA